MLVFVDVIIEYVTVQEAAWQVIPEIHENRAIEKTYRIKPIHIRQFTKEKRRA